MPTFDMARPDLAALILLTTLLQCVTSEVPAAPDHRGYVNNCTGESPSEVSKLWGHRTLCPASNGVVHSAQKKHYVWEPHILGGSEATPGQLPFQVAITASNTSRPMGICGGSLISDNVVLTAAHCIHDFSNFEVILGTLRALDTGSANRVTVRTSRKVVHPDFDFANGLNNDIGLLILPEPVDLNSFIQPILLPSLRDAEDSFEGRVGRTSGWGKVDDDPLEFINEDLLWVDVDVIDTGECKWAYGEAFVTPTKMCVFTAGGTRGPCNGDSGGPLFLTNSDGEEIVVGITSFGATVGCTCGYPDVYTRVTSFLEWIAENGGPAVRP